MEEVYSYKGHRVRVCAIQRDASVAVWEILLFINGTRHLGTVFAQHPNVFSDSRSAIAFGKEAAEDLIDNPVKANQKL
jgi:hypothetical protein